eukprot:Nitzschia sp. Nitz4//scaffold228_size32365//1941//8051//NITZ4_007904-RA/size32365-snap-gene-0.26-mRNA-1//1//CDS//3329542813//4070//frame0
MALMDSDSSSDDSSSSDSEAMKRYMRQKLGSVPSPAPALASKPTTFENMFAKAGLDDDSDSSSTPSGDSTSGSSSSDSKERAKAPSGLPKAPPMAAFGSYLTKGDNPKEETAPQSPIKAKHQSLAAGFEGFLKTHPSPVKKSKANDSSSSSSSSTSSGSSSNKKNAQTSPTNYSALAPPLTNSDSETSDKKQTATDPKDSTESDGSNSSEGTSSHSTSKEKASQKGSSSGSSGSSGSRSSVSGQSGKNSGGSAGGNSEPSRGESASSSHSGSSQSDRSSKGSQDSENGSASRGSSQTSSHLSASSGGRSSIGSKSSGTQSKASETSRSAGSRSEETQERAEIPSSVASGSRSSRSTSQGSRAASQASRPSVTASSRASGSYGENSASKLSQASRSSRSSSVSRLPPTSVASAGRPRSVASGSGSSGPASQGSNAPSQKDGSPSPGPASLQASSHGKSKSSGSQSGDSPSKASQASGSADIATPVEENENLESAVRPSSVGSRSVPSKSSEGRQSEGDASASSESKKSIAEQDTGLDAADASAPSPGQIASTPEAPGSQEPATSRTSEPREVEVAEANEQSDIKVPEDAISPGASQPKEPEPNALTESQGPVDPTIAVPVPGDLGPEDEFLPVGEMGAPEKPLHQDQDQIPKEHELPASPTSGDQGSKLASNNSASPRQTRDSLQGAAVENGMNNESTAVPAATSVPTILQRMEERRRALQAKQESKASEPETKPPMKPAVSAFNKVTSPQGENVSSQEKGVPLPPKIVPTAPKTDEVNTKVDSQSDYDPRSNDMDEWKALMKRSTLGTGKPVETQARDIPSNNISAAPDNNVDNTAIMEDEPGWVPKISNIHFVRPQEKVDPPSKVTQKVSIAATSNQNTPMNVATANFPVAEIVVYPQDDESSLGSMGFLFRQPNTSPAKKSPMVPVKEEVPAQQPVTTHTMKPTVAGIDYDYYKSWMAPTPAPEPIPIPIPTPMDSPPENKVPPVEAGSPPREDPPGVTTVFKPKKVVVTPPHPVPAMLERKEAEVQEPVMIVSAAILDRESWSPPKTMRTLKTPQPRHMSVLSKKPDEWEAWKVVRRTTTEAEGSNVVPVVEDSSLSSFWAPPNGKIPRDYVPRKIETVSISPASTPSYKSSAKSSPSNSWAPPTRVMRVDFTGEIKSQGSSTSDSNQKGIQDEETISGSEDTPQEMPQEEASQSSSSSESTETEVEEASVDGGDEESEQESYVDFKPDPDVMQRPKHMEAVATPFEEKPSAVPPPPRSPVVVEPILKSSSFPQKPVTQTPANTPTQEESLFAGAREATFKYDNNMGAPTSSGRFWCLLIILLILGGAAGVTIYFILSKDDEGSSPSATDDVVSSPSQSPTSWHPTSDISEVLYELIVSASPDTATQLALSNSASSRAFEWLTENRYIGSFSEVEMLQRFFLATLYYSTNGDSWDRSDTWMSDVDECNWYTSETQGEICNADSELDELDLNDNGLVGTIPWTQMEVIASQLVVFDLSGNNLFGSLLDTDATFSSLLVFDVGSNLLSGTIPAAIENLSAVRQLDLSQNRLEGTIPTTISKLTSMQTLLLNGNSLTGTVPTVLGRLTKLSSLYLNGNDFSGSIPQEICDLDLTELQVDCTLECSCCSYCHTGDDDDSVGGSLYELIIESFPASIPSLADSTTPQWMAFEWLSSSVNEWVTDDDQLLQRYALATLYYSAGGSQWSSKRSWLSATDECAWFSSTTSDTICDLFGNIIELNLNGNNLEGTIPPEIALLSNGLELLDLQSNSLTGTIPTELCQLTLLEQLNLSSNDLDGDIPTDIWALRQLRRLVIIANKLDSTIPDELGLLSNLVLLDLGLNQLTGTIPSSLGSIDTLAGLSLYENELTGTIPTQLARLSDLQLLYIDGNNLSGTVPNGVCQLDLEEFWGDCDDIQCTCCTTCS